MYHLLNYTQSYTKNVRTNKHENLNKHTALIHPKNNVITIRNGAIIANICNFEYSKDVNLVLVIDPCNTLTVNLLFPVFVPQVLSSAKASLTQQKFSK